MSMHTAVPKATDRKEFCRYIAKELRENPTAFSDFNDLLEGISAEVDYLQFMERMLEKGVTEKIGVEATEALWKDVEALMIVINGSCDIHYRTGVTLDEEIELQRKYIGVCVEHAELIEKYLFYITSEEYDVEEKKDFVVYHVLEHLSDDYADLGLLPVECAIESVECLFRFILETSLDRVTGVVTLPTFNEQVSEEQILHDRWTKYLKSISTTQEEVVPT